MSGAGTGTPASVSTGLFTTAEARAFDKGQLDNETTYPTVTITAKHDEIKEWFDRVLGVNCYRTTHTAEIHDGDGSNYLLLNWPMVSSVTAISVDGTAFTAGELSTTDYDAGLAIDEERGIIRRRSGTFTAGWDNVSITYVAGYSAVPALIKRAALEILVTELPATNVPFGAESYDAGGMSIPFARGDGWQGNYSSLPDVAKALRLYSYKNPGIA